MMTEQSLSDQLVRDLRVAEDTGFDVSVISGHYFLWLEAAGSTAAGAGPADQR